MESRNLAWTLKTRRSRRAAIVVTAALVAGGFGAWLGDGRALAGRRGKRHRNKNSSNAHSTGQGGAGGAGGAGGNVDIIIGGL